MKKISVVCLLMLCFSSLFSQERNPLILKDDFENQKKWVDSIYENMSLQEKVGQLFMADIFSSDPQANVDRIKSLITDYHLGGVIFSKGGPGRQAKINNEFQ